MKRIARILALIAGLFPAMVAAQAPNLPANTLYGRLGVPSTGGPAQAIPFPQLLSQLLGIARGGKARMIPHVGQTAAANDCYSLTDPFGNPIACTTSTTTQGLQEFLNAVAASGWKFAEIDCAVGTQFSSGQIEATTSVNVPAMQDQVTHFHGCNLNFNVVTVPGLIIDSQGASIFDFDGKIVYNVTTPNGNTTVNPSCVVYINPTTNTQDGFPGLYAGYFRVKSPVANPLGGATMTGVVCINVGTGSTIEQRLDFTEVNANNATDYGVMVFGASSTTGLIQTEININQIHGSVIDALNEGVSSTNQGNNNGIFWTLNNVETFSGRGIHTFGSNDNWKIGTINGAQGTLATGIFAESGANNNRFDYSLITSPTTAAFTDSGTCNSISGPQGTVQALWGSTSGCTKIKPAAAASGSLTFPAGTTDFSSTGGTSQVVKQVTAGAPFTVAQLACADLSNSGPDCSALRGQLPGTTTNDNASAGNVGEYMVSSCPNQTAAVTITIAAPAVVTYTGHGYSNTAPHADTCPIVFTTSGALPTGITAGTTYWTIPSSLTTNTTQVATSIANALAGTAVNTTGTQSGTQTATANVAITNNNAFSVTGLNVTAGDWDCRATLADNPAGSTVTTAVTAAVNQTSNTLPAPFATGAYGNVLGSSTGSARVSNTGPGRFSNSATTITYAVLQAAFTTSTNAAQGDLACRRVR